MRIALAVRLLLVAALLPPVLHAAATGALAAEPSVKAALDRLVKSPSSRFRIGLSVLDLHSSSELYSHNSRLPLKPASVLKIVTSAAALRKLGPDYQFETRFLIDGSERDFWSSGKAGALYVEGGGDPSLTVEDLWVAARALVRRGVRSVDKIVLDAGRFDTALPREGQRAYEAGSSALSLNFNTVAFDVCPGSPGQSARVSVDPRELGIEIVGAIKTVRGRGGAYRIDELRASSEARAQSFKVSGNLGAGRGCEVVYRSVADPAYCFGAVFAGYLELLGVIVHDKPEPGMVPDGARKLYSHRSKALSQIVEDLNHYSNNFTAEQILTAIGIVEQDHRDREVGLAELTAYLHLLKFKEGEFNIADGSGLSHQSRLSARAVTAVLSDMFWNAELRPEFEKSLSVAGRNGTLKQRSFGGSVVLRGKTGTLDGVSSLAGYLVTREGRSLAFAILQNGIRSKAAAVSREEKLVKALYAAAL